MMRFLWLKRVSLPMRRDLAAAFNGSYHGGEVTLRIMGDGG